MTPFNPFNRNTKEETSEERVRLLNLHEVECYSSNDERREEDGGASSIVEIEYETDERFTERENRIFNECEAIIKQCESKMEDMRLTMNKNKKANLRDIAVVTSIIGTGFFLLTCIFIYYASTCTLK